MEARVLSYVLSEGIRERGLSEGVFWLELERGSFGLGLSLYNLIMHKNRFRGNWVHLGSC